MSAASSSAQARAIGNCTPWLAPIGRPNTTRSLAYSAALRTNQRPSPTASLATRTRSAFIPSRM
jgi:hypothetical protein